VERLRAIGEKVGLVRPRLVRPLPIAALRAALAGKRGVAVIDQNLSLGRGGVLYAELASALYGQPDAPPVLASFVGGLGGYSWTDSLLAADVSRGSNAHDILGVAALVGLQAIAYHLLYPGAGEILPGDLKRRKWDSRSDPLGQ